MAQVFDLHGRVKLLPPENAGQIINQLANQLRGFKIQVDVTFSPRAQQEVRNTSAQVAQLRDNLKQTSQAASETSSQVDKVGTSAGRSAAQVQQLQRSIRTVAASALESARSLQTAANFAENFGHQAALAARRFAAFSLAAGSVIRLTSAFRQGIADAIKFDRELVRVAQVGGASRAEIRELSDEVTRLSTTLGVSSQELLSTARVFRQAGLSINDTKQALEALAHAALAPNFGSLQDTTEGAIAAMRQFNISARQLIETIGSINAVAGEFAVEAEDITRAIQTTGGAFSIVGGNLHELIALFTSVRATTRESADAISTGLRTIFTRLQRSSTVDALKDLGIELRRTREEAAALGNVHLADQFVGGFEAIRRISEGLRNIPATDPRFASIIEEIGGFRQVSRVIPLIQQFSESQRALNVSQTGSASLFRSSAVAGQSLEVQLTRTTEKFQEFFRTLTQSQGVNFIVGQFIKLADAIASVGKVVAPVLPLLALFGLGTAVRNAIPFGRGFYQTIQAAPTTNGRRFSSGGPVPGFGNGDTVPAMLEPGEFVLRKDATQRIGVANLHRLNRGGPVSSKDVLEYIRRANQKTGVNLGRGITSVYYDKNFQDEASYSPHFGNIILGQAGPDAVLHELIHGADRLAGLQNLHNVHQAKVNPLIRMLGMSQLDEEIAKTNFVMENYRTPYRTSQPNNPVRNFNNAVGRLTSIDLAHRIANTKSPILRGAYYENFKYLKKPTERLAHGVQFLLGDNPANSELGQIHDSLSSYSQSHRNEAASLFSSLPKLYQSEVVPFLRNATSGPSIADYIGKGILPESGELSQLERLLPRRYASGGFVPNQEYLEAALTEFNKRTGIDFNKIVPGGVHLLGIDDRLDSVLSDYASDQTMVSIGTFYNRYKSVLLNKDKLSDQASFKYTLAHELGHGVDAYFHDVNKNNYNYPRLSAYLERNEGVYDTPEFLKQHISSSDKYYLSSLIPTTTPYILSRGALKNLDTSYNARIARIPLERELAEKDRAGRYRYKSKLQEVFADTFADYASGVKIGKRHEVLMSSILDKLPKKYASGDLVQQHRPLTPEELEAIIDYTGVYSHDVNSILRGYNFPLGKYTSRSRIPEVIKGTTTGLKAGRIANPKTLFRYTSDTAVEAIARQIGVGNLFSSTAIGKVFQDRGFLSTSKSPSATNHFGSNRFEIIPKLGAHALDLNEAKATIQPFEDEVLLQRASRFGILGVNPSKNIIRLQQFASGDIVQNLPTFFDKLHKEFGIDFRKGTAGLYRLNDDFFSGLGPNERKASGLFYPLSGRTLIRAGSGREEDTLFHELIHGLDRTVGLQNGFYRSPFYYSKGAGKEIAPFTSTVLNAIHEFVPNVPELRSYLGSPEEILAHGANIAYGFGGDPVGLNKYITGEKARKNIRDAFYSNVIPFLHKRLENHPGLPGYLQNNTLLDEFRLSNIEPLRYNKGDYVNVRGFATGGSPKDQVPALLTPGEFVFSRDKVQEIGLNNLRAANQTGDGRYLGLNKGGIVPGYAEGDKTFDIRQFRERLRRELTNTLPFNPEMVENEIRQVMRSIREQARNITGRRGLTHRQVRELFETGNLTADTVGGGQLTGVTVRPQSPDIIPLETEAQARRRERANRRREAANTSDTYRLAPPEPRFRQPRGPYGSPTPPTAQPFDPLADNTRGLPRLVANRIRSELINQFGSIDNAKGQLGAGLKVYTEGIKKRFLGEATTQQAAILQQANPKLKAEEALQVASLQVAAAYKQNAKAVVNVTGQFIGLEKNIRLIEQATGKIPGISGGGGLFRNILGFITGRTNLQGQQLTQQDQQNRRFRFGAGAFALTSTLPLLDQHILQQFAQSPETAVRGGTEGRFLGISTASGALQGAAIGASLGLGVSGGNPIGALVGGLIGGGLGLASSLREAASQIRQVKIGDALNRVATNFELLNASFQTGRNLQTNVSDFVSSIGSAQRLIREQATREATGYFGFNIDTFRGANIRLQREQFGSQTGNFVAVLNQLVARELRQRPAGERPEDAPRNAVASVLQGGDAQNLLQIVSQIRTVSTAVIREQLEQQAINQHYATQIQRTTQEINQLGNSFGTLTNHINSFVQSIEAASTGADHLAQISLGQVPSRQVRTGPLGGLLGTSLFEEEFRRVTGLLGPQGAGFTQTGLQANRIIRQGGNILGGALATANGADLEQVISRNLRDLFGQNEATSTTTSLIRNISASFANFSEEQRTNALLNPAGVFRQIADQSGLNTLVEAVEQLRQATQAFSTNTTSREGAREQLIQQRNNFATLGDRVSTQLERTVLQFSLQRQGRESQFFRQFPAAREDQLFAASQRRLLAPVGNVNGLSAGNLGAALAQRQADLQKLEEQLARPVGIQQRVRLEAQFRDTARQAIVLQRALENLSNATERNAHLQERLNSISREEESIRGTGRTILTNEAVQNARLDRGLRLAVGADRSGTNLRNLPLAQRRLIFDSLQAFRDIPVFGEHGGDIENRLLRRSGFALRPDRQTERDQLQAQVVANLKEAANALSVLEKSIQNPIDNLTRSLREQNQQFLSRLEELFRNQRVDILRPELNRARAHLEDLQGVDLSSLRRFGINNNNLSRFRGNGVIESLRRINEITTELEGQANEANNFISEHNINTLATSNFRDALNVNLRNPQPDRQFRTFLQTQTGLNLPPSVLNRLSPTSIALRVANEGGVLSRPGGDINAPITTRNAFNQTVFTQEALRYLTSQHGRQRFAEAFLREARDVSLTNIENAHAARISPQLSRINELTGARLDVSQFQSSEDIGRLLSTLDQVRQRNITNLDDFSNSVSRANQAVINLTRQIQAIHNPASTLTQVTAAGLAASGNPFAALAGIAHAKGGPIYGSGMGDSVPALLTPGEFVVNRDSTRNNFSLLQHINAKRFASGGLVNPFNFAALGTQYALNAAQHNLGINRFREIASTAFARKDGSDYGTSLRIARARRTLGLGGLNDEQARSILRPVFEHIQNTPFERRSSREVANIFSQGRRGVFQDIANQRRRAINDRIENILSTAATTTTDSSPEARQQILIARRRLGLNRFTEDQIQNIVGRTLGRVDLQDRLQAFTLLRNSRGRLTDEQIDILARVNQNNQLQQQRLGASRQASIYNYSIRQLQFRHLAGGVGGYSPFFGQSGLNGAAIAGGVESRFNALGGAGFLTGLPIFGGINNARIGSPFHFASGGPVSGYGNGDTVPAMLTPGEFVLNRNAVQRFGLNNLDRANRFAQGGPVGSSSSFSLSGVDQFSSAINLFGQNAEKLSQVLQKLPTSISLEGKQTVEVVINGAEVLQSVMPEVQKLIEVKTREALANFVKTKMPDLGGV